MSGRWDAVVAGAGPAGAATALRLAAGGARVLLLDRARFPRHKPCSEYLSPVAVAALERLGVRAELETAGAVRISGMHVVAPDGTIATGRFGAAVRHGPPVPYGLALPRSTLDTVLVRAALRAGAEVREGAAVEEPLLAGGAVDGLRVRRVGSPPGAPEAVRARVVIAADGLRSVIARRLGIRRQGALRRLAFTAHVVGVRDVEDFGEMHVGARGYAGFGPVGGGVTTVALVLPVPRVRHAGPATRAAFFALLDAFPRIRGRFDGARLVRPILATGPFAQHTAASVADGVLFVGDAADFFDPFTGQGLTAALVGGELAARAALGALAAGGAGPLPAAALAPYAAARRRAFAGKWVIERLVGWGVAAPALAGRVIRRLARDPRLADLLVGATAGFVPARAVLGPTALAALLG